MNYVHRLNKHTVVQGFLAYCKLCHYRRAFLSCNTIGNVLFIVQEAIHKTEGLTVSKKNYKTG